MTETCKLFVIDDDPDIRDMLEEYLGEQGYEVFAASDGNGLRALLMEHVPNVVLLDVGLPGEDGLSLARYLREHYDVGIMMVSGAGETVDRIIGLEVGADDYIAKPFDPRELRARLKSVLRRYQRAQPPASAGQRVRPTQGANDDKQVLLGRCTLDMDSYQLFDAEGNEIAITSMEFDLLKVFIERANRPLSRDQILSLTQNRDWDPFDRSIDIRIARLRRKIEPDPDKPQIIKTVRGVGYMFVSPDK